MTQQITDHSDAACRARLMKDEAQQFETLVRSICPVGGNVDEYGVRLGNVEFWIDADGPWAGQLSHSIPTSQWDINRIAADLQAKLIESAWSK